MDPARTPAVPGTGVGLSRRQLLRAAGALGAAAGLSGLTGCASSSTEGTVRFWTLLAGPDGILMDELLGRVQDDTSAAVEAITLAWGAPYYTKLAMASAGGRAPELGVMHLSRLAGYAPGGLLDPWDMDLMAEFDLGEEDFPEEVRQRAAIAGGTFAIPLDTHPFIMWVNPKILDKAGLDRETLASTEDPDAFLDSLREVRRATGDIAFSYDFTADGSAMWRFFYTLYKQQGVDLELVPGQPPGLDRDAATTALDYLRTLIVECGEVQGGGAGFAAFLGERCGVHFGGGWDLASLQDAGLPIDAAPVPILYGTPASYVDSHSLVLPHQADPDPDVRRLTHQVVASMLKESLLWAQAGHIPSYRPVVESQEYADLEIQSHYAQAAQQAVLDPEVWFTGAGSEFQVRVGQAMQSALTGEGSPQASVEQMEAEMIRLLEQPAPQ